MTLASAEYPFLNVMATMLVFFCWVAWFGLLFVAIGDLYRRSDASGWAKAGWTLLMLVLPVVGVLLYLGIEGRRLHDRRRAREAAAERRFAGYVRSVSTSDTTSAAQIAEARRLLDDGVINDTEYQTLMRKALAP
ncbi:PLDc N-terminal domain-containing protein [Amycolatopsis sp. NPDC004079]|uniref:PLDc N-terminal domain-containing protein n=1 Tax=Amycolatopsis sp. NPDC004079 TaxID=3154549 RepID=UPI0033AF8CF5